MFGNAIPSSLLFHFAVIRFLFLLCGVDVASAIAQTASSYTDMALKDTYTVYCIVSTLLVLTILRTLSMMIHQCGREKQKRMKHT